MSALAITFSITAALAAALHVFIFYLESFAWTTKARTVFGTSEEDAINTKEMAFNQGFYNLFLAIVTIAGIIAYPGSHAVGRQARRATPAHPRADGRGRTVAATLSALAAAGDRAFAFRRLRFLTEGSHNPQRRGVN